MSIRDDRELEGIPFNHIIANDIMGDEPITYKINVELENVEGVHSNPDNILKGTIATLKFNGLEGYELPEDVCVCKAKAHWNRETGELVISHACSDVYVRIVGEGQYRVSEELSHCVGDISNPVWISKNAEESIFLYTADDGYILPDEITVSNVERYEWNSLTGVLKVYKASSDISIQITAEEDLRIAGVYTDSGYTEFAMLPNSAGEYAGRPATWNNLKLAYPDAFRVPGVISGKSGYSISVWPDLSGYLVIPDEITEIRSDAFENCQQLVNVEFPEGLTIIGMHAFTYCKFSSIVIPNTVTTIYQGGFSGCNQLTEITLPFIGNTRTSQGLKFFGFIFGAGNHSRQGEYIPSLLRTVRVTDERIVSSEGFYGCDKITSIIYTKEITKIEKNAFRNCSGLTSFDIPESVSSIGNYVFDGCTALSSVIFGDTDKWYTGSEVGSKETLVDSSILSNPSTAANYLKNTTAKYKYWTKDSEYVSLIKRNDWNYDVLYDSIDYTYARSYFEEQRPEIDINGQCTVIRNGLYYGRNFDWLYDDTIDFEVMVKANGSNRATIGRVGSVSDLTREFVESLGYSKMYWVLPFLIVDGMNSSGLICNSNVVPVEKGDNRRVIPSGEIEDEICGMMLVRYVLDKFDDAQTAVEYLTTHVAVYPSVKLLEDYHYEEHFMIADRFHTYILEFVNGGYSVLEDLNIMTNFHLSGVEFNSDGTVYTPATQTSEHDAKRTNHITDNGSGLERYNLVVENYSSCNNPLGMRNMLNRLFYTNAYRSETSPAWNTEFVGLRSTTSEALLTVSSPASEFTRAKEAAEEMFNHRTHGDGTWETKHSVVYDMSELTVMVISNEDVSNVYTYNFSFND